MNLATYGCQIDAKYENQVIIKKEIQVKSLMRTKFVCPLFYLSYV